MGRIYLVHVATVLAAMVLGYVIKDMGGRIDDAFGSQYFYQWQLPVLVSYSPL
jgi:hypothetical protein